MKISENKKASKRKILIALSVVVVLLLAAGAIFAYASSSWPFDSLSQTKDSQTETTSPLGTPQETTPEDKDPVKAPSQYEGSDPNTSASLTGFISYSSVMDGNLVIRITIDQAVSSGTCKLTLTKGSASVTKTSTIVANPSSSTCSGFDVPTTELSSGVWDVQINITSEDKKGIINGETTI